MSNEQAEGRERLGELMRSNTPLYSDGGDPDDPNDPLNYQPHNIPAVIDNHLRTMDANDPERMRSFSLRIEEDHHTRLVLLADALGVSKTTLARELLQAATMEAIYSLPVEIREDVRQKFLESL